MKIVHDIFRLCMCVATGGGLSLCDLLAISIPPSSAPYMQMTLLSSCLAGDYCPTYHTAYWHFLYLVVLILANVLISKCTSSRLFPTWSG